MNETFFENHIYGFENESGKSVFKFSLSHFIVSNQGFFATFHLVLVAEKQSGKI
jgi:hypothetical protein